MSCNWTQHFQPEIIWIHSLDAIGHSSIHFPIFQNHVREDFEWMLSYRTFPVRQPDYSMWTCLQVLRRMDSVQFSMTSHHLHSCLSLFKWLSTCVSEELFCRDMFAYICWISFDGRNFLPGIFFATSMFHNQDIRACIT